MSSSPLHAALVALSHGASLSRDDAARAFGCIMRGEGTAAQVSALLMGLRVKGESPEELAGAATALREAMTVLHADAPEALVDTCGTGGGTVTTFNISTAAALLAAGAGVRVAKHGNRSFTSKSGSADVLEALGVRIDVPVERMRDVLDRAGIVFMFAPTMHPAMRHVGPVRRELSIQTVMNLVGPLANPAKAGRQVIGVADSKRLGLMGGALQALGTVHSLVVHGAPGLDEVSPLAATTVLELVEGEARTWTIDPERVGMPLAKASDLAGGDPAANARVIEAVLSGGGTSGAAAAVTLNAAAALYVAGLADDYAAAVAMARDALRAGVGRDALEKLRKESARAAG